MPFQSKAQMGAAFGGELGPEMQGKADAWAKETPNIKHLPQHKGKSKGNPALAGLKRATVKNDKDGDE